MSKTVKVVLQCADCRNQFDAEIWTEINIADQEVDHKLYSDQINVFECDECQNAGLVCYPIAIKDTLSGEQAIAIPLNKVISIDDDVDENYNEINPAFFVVEIKKKKPRRVSYDLNQLKFEIQRWRGEPFTPYLGPPDEAMIMEGLSRGFINKGEAEKLRIADWEAIEDKMIEEGVIKKEMIDMDAGQDEALEIYFRLQLELDRSMKVIELSKVKK